ncbi:hypothetical protein J6590_049134 [Homalodisca vitripennis]|nr:hypothetical protein J6590_049134 [Homalodisca vitripennis]
MRPRGSQRNDYQLSQQDLECDRKRIREYSVLFFNGKLRAKLRETASIVPCIAERVGSSTGMSDTQHLFTIHFITMQCTCIHRGYLGMQILYSHQ